MNISTQFTNAYTIASIKDGTATMPTRWDGTQHDINDCTALVFASSDLWELRRNLERFLREVVNEQVDDGKDLEDITAEVAYEDDKRLLRVDNLVLDRHIFYALRILLDFSNTFAEKAEFEATYNASVRAWTSEDAEEKFKNDEYEYLDYQDDCSRIL